MFPIPNIKSTQLCSQFKISDMLNYFPNSKCVWEILNSKTKHVQGVLATYWFSAGIEDFSAADVWTLKYGNLPHRNKSRSMMESLLSHPSSSSIATQRLECTRVRTLATPSPSGQLSLSPERSYGRWEEAVLETLIFNEWGFRMQGPARTGPKERQYLGPGKGQGGKNTGYLFLQRYLILTSSEGSSDSS